MGITGWRIREGRQNARLSREPGGAFMLDTGNIVNVEGFRLSFVHQGIEVIDSKGIKRAQFSKLRPGERRGWQELQIDLIEVEPRILRFNAFIRPGSPCFGSGNYLGVKPGLRIEFPDGIAVTVLEVPPKIWTVRVEGPGIRETLQFEIEDTIRVGNLEIKGRTGMLYIEEID